MDQHTDHDEEHRKIRRDLWEGDGLRNPSVTTRLAVLEETMDKLTSNINKLIWLVVSLIATVIGNMVFHSIVR
jgi:hypothetical protein